ncbi:MAG: response regulator transcription factor [Clostridia bacterium]|nr:response regulator transcription factor [Clostridia bacterium]
MKKILVVEDERSIREFIVINLVHNGYKTFEAANGVEALEIYNNNTDIDIVLCDVMMPEMDGVTLSKILREKNRTLGIVMLTAKTQEEDKITGLFAGADDYITKPFSPSELMARLEAIYRRVSVSRESLTDDKKSNLIKQGCFTLNKIDRTFMKNRERIELTQVEFQIMYLFFEHKGETLKRSFILEKIWGDNYYGDEKVVDVNIRRLRLKIEDDPNECRHLTTVWGLGYCWIAD